MAIGEQPKDISKSKALIPAEPPGISPADVREPTPPQGLTEEELQQLKERALALVDQLVESSGSREMELADSITSLGIQSQRRAGTELDLLKGRMGELLSQDGPGGQISRELVDLRVTLDQINPHQAGKTWSAGRLLGKVPFLGNTALRTLEKIAIRYEPVSRQVSLIETRLRDGRAVLARDNVELRKLYEQVEEQQLPIRKNAYMAEVVMQQLSETLERTGDILRKERIRNVLHDLAMRVQDLRT
ncbi:MAG: toxic anion resistance protein, partial [Dehalococcoidia bacterium]